MNLLHYGSVHGGWEDVANPDDVVVTLTLDRTTHEFYPSARDLVRMYDAVVDGREESFTIGTADRISYESIDDELVRVDLAPVSFNVERGVWISELEDLLRTVFEAKDEQSTTAQRADGIEAIQLWLDDHSGETDVEALYRSLTSV